MDYEPIWEFRYRHQLVPEWAFTPSRHPEGYLWRNCFPVPALDYACQTVSNGCAVCISSLTGLPYGHPFHDQIQVTVIRLHQIHRHWNSTQQLV